VGKGKEARAIKLPVFLTLGEIDLSEQLNSKTFPGQKGIREYGSSE